MTMDPLQVIFISHMFFFFLFPERTATGQRSRKKFIDDVEI